MSPLSPAEYGLTVAIFTLGGLAGSMSAGHITGRLGRVGSLRVASSSTLIGLVFIGLANYVRVMICGRILVGFGCGLSIAVVPLHLAELPPKSLRSALGTLTQLFIVAGICLGQALSFFWDEAMLWRNVFWLAGGVALVQLLGSFFMARTTSPMQGANAESVEVHPLLPSQEDVMSIRELVTSSDPEIRRGLHVVVAVMLFQQLCGISPVMYFTTRILTPVFDQEARAVAFLLIVMKVLITLISALFVKRFGPKNLLAYPTLVMSGAGVCLTAGIVRSSGSVSAVSMAVFIAAFACGLGPITWLVPSEVMPRRARNGVTFIPLQELLGKGRPGSEGYVFLLFSACSLSGE
ncbi:hypothetical protein JCM24511_10008 [Saitozyma sp. JCM 24511]|nr:hypothetical protein JCM24511_10008 [Saitozyma sp. JCM 24511]